jgi:DUF2075 family protein
LEFEYTGVIIGNDLDVVDGVLITVPLHRARTDKSLKGLITKIRKKDINAIAKADIIIRNTYRVLLTRGMQGCGVYFTNERVKEYFRKYMK